MHRTGPVGDGRFRKPLELRSAPTPDEAKAVSAATSTRIPAVYPDPLLYSDDSGGLPRYVGLGVKLEKAKTQEFVLANIPEEGR
jgi:hypothetical protein